MFHTPRETCNCKELKRKDYDASTLMQAIQTEGSLCAWISIISVKTYLSLTWLESSGYTQGYKQEHSTLQPIGGTLKFMAQIINFIITLAEMIGLRGVSSYSRASNAYNAIGIVLLALSIFLNVFFMRDLYETKRAMAHLKIEANEIIILKTRLAEKEAAIRALSEALSMFVPDDAAARFREKQKDDYPSLTPAPTPEPAKPEQKVTPKPAALPHRESDTKPEKRYL